MIYLIFFFFNSKLFYYYYYLSLYLMLVQSNIFICLFFIIPFFAFGGVLLYYSYLIVSKVRNKVQLAGKFIRIIQRRAEEGGCWSARWDLCPAETDASLPPPLISSTTISDYKEFSGIFSFCSFSLVFSCLKICSMFFFLFFISHLKQIYSLQSVTENKKLPLRINVAHYYFLLSLETKRKYRDPVKVPLYLGYTRNIRLRSADVLRKWHFHARFYENWHCLA